MPLHKVLEYRDITTESLAMMSDEEFFNANRSFIVTINKHRNLIVSNDWLSSGDIDGYVNSFRKAERAKGNDECRRYRKATEGIIILWNKGSLNPDRTDVYDDEFFEIYDALYTNMQHIDYLTDEQWHEKYKGLTADRRSEVYERRKAALDYVDFPNPCRKEMVAAWRLPDGYDWQQGMEAFSDLETFLPKAMTLYSHGDYLSALGISFDLLDMLMVMKSCEPRFFFDDSMATLYPWALAEVTLFPICKIYNAPGTPSEVKSEIFSRIEAYGKQYSFPEHLATFRPYDPQEVLSTFGSPDSERDFYDFFGGSNSK